MAARKTAIGKGTMPDRWRQKIRTSMLVNRLEAIVEGRVVAEPHQITAALGLLRKTLPDLANVEHSGDADKPIGLMITWQQPK